MALPILFRKLFKSSGYGPELNDEIVSRYISVQDWSNVYDYPVNTLARGSDGLLYWSIAQSGPNVGGAQDPTLDDGTYWSSMPVASPGVLDRSSKSATTQWVQDAFGLASLYVDPVNGNDANDGLSLAKAVKTIAQALALSNGRIGFPQIVYLAGGTYSENIDIAGQTVFFVLLGNVTISGQVLVEKGSYIDIENEAGQSYSLSISTSATVLEAVVFIQDASFLQIGCAVSITTSGTYDYIVALTRSSQLFIKNGITITETGNVKAGIVITNTSVLTCSSVSMSLNSGLRGVVVDSNSFCIFSTGSAISISGNSVNTSINVLNGSVCRFASCSLSLVGLSGISVLYSSEAYVESSTGTITGTVSGGNLITCSHESCVNIQTSTLTLYGGTVSARALYCSANSEFNIASGSYTFSGSFSYATATSISNSFMFIAAGCTLSGTPTGKRYTVEVASILNTSNGGANRIPGSVAGTVDTTHYAVYL